MVKMLKKLSSIEDKSCPQLRTKPGRIDTSARLGVLRGHIKKNSTTQTTATLAQEDSCVEDLDFYSNCMLKGETLTLIEANN